MASSSELLFPAVRGREPPVQGREQGAERIPENVVGGEGLDSVINFCSLGLQNYLKSMKYCV